MEAPSRAAAPQPPKDKRVQKQVNFKEQVVSSFLAADIPLHKLNHPSLKFLFARMGKVLPLKTAAWACVAKLASQKDEQIQELLRDKNFF